MEKKDKISIKGISENVEIPEEEFDDYDLTNTNSNSNTSTNSNTNIKTKIWITEIHDFLYPLFYHYIKLDDRLKWISLPDLLYGSSSIKNINDDEIIIDFINKFVDEIDDIFDWMINKNLEIMEEDKIEFQKIMSLNENKLYPRIAYCLEKWYSN